MQFIRAINMDLPWSTRRTTGKHWSCSRAFDGKIAAGEAGGVSEHDEHGTPKVLDMYLDSELLV